MRHLDNELNKANAASTPKVRILTLDDDENIRMLLCAFLGRIYDVTALEDGLAGMSWLYQGNFPDLILVDIDMPKLNGYEFLRNVHYSGFFGHIPIIMLSGMDQEEIKARCLNSGASAFLVKPFNPEEILKTIDQVLIQKKQVIA